LVVEDNVINQEVICELLGQVDCDVDLAEDGVAALAALEKRAYPLVLMDCQMPNMDGYEATRRIRQLDGPKNRVRIIGVSAHAVAADRAKALAAGMNDYLTKPVEMKLLSEKLHRWLPQRYVAKLSRPPRGASLPVLSAGVKRSSKVSTLFLDLVPGQLDEIGESIQTSNAELLKQRAHKLKGSCTAVGAKKMAELCAQLEPFPTNAAEVYDDLRATFDSVARALRVELSAQALQSAGT
jgi:CheY-like chemotaxis protein/HPt (histidine-containing phosphotransfer) domain-containing protein